MKHHYNKEELVELKRKYDMQVSKEALEEIKHSIDLDKEIEKLLDYITNLQEGNEKLKETGKYKYACSPYTSIAIHKGKNGKYRVFAYGENEASIPCNYCPNCGKELKGGSSNE